MSISILSSILRRILPKGQEDRNREVLITDVIEQVKPPGTKPPRSCEWCGAQFYPASVNNRFCTKECRLQAESKYRAAKRAKARQERAARAAEPVTEPEPEPEPTPRLVRLQIVAPVVEQPVTKSHMNEMASEAKCSEPDNIDLPWVAGDANHGDLKRMMNLCLECPILNKCAMYAQESEASGVWAAAALNMGRTRLWLCPSCRAMNDGGYDLCAACKRASIPFRARATIATRQGRNVYPKRKPIELPTVQAGSPLN